MKSPFISVACRFNDWAVTPDDALADGWLSLNHPAVPGHRASNVADLAMQPSIREGFDRM
jgi:hypothetical protein